jgi:hypothetical protein
MGLSISREPSAGPSVERDVERFESWLLSAGIHGALVLGALLLGFGLDSDGGGGFPGAPGEPTWQVGLVERAGDGILRADPDPVETEAAEVVIPQLATCLDRVNQRAKLSNLSGGALPRCTCAFRTIGFATDCPVHLSRHLHRLGCQCRKHLWGEFPLCGNDEFYENGRR